MAKKVRNYGNGKVHKIEPITDHEEGEVYVGSTTKKYLSQRMDKHRSGYKAWQNGSISKVMVYDLFAKYGIDNCQMILIENFPCESNDELRARETHFVKTIACINKHIPKRSKAEYRKDNINYITSQKHQYYMNNKETIALKGKQYRDENKEVLIGNSVIYRAKTKEQKQDYDRIYRSKQEHILCSCGGKYFKRHEKRHNLNLAHVQWLKSNTKL